jgi:hypothetical protein
VIALAFRIASRLWRVSTFFGFVSRRLLPVFPVVLTLPGVGSVAVAVFRAY